jgi:diguanylate cyclase (GGDEF)-like protein
MPVALGPHTTPLDLPTLLFVAVCLTGVLGLFLIFAWLKERNIRALAWWGAAYLIGASSLALWSAPTPLFTLPADLPAALIFIACGMILNGVRLFRGRPVMPLTIFAGAIAWLGLCQLPAVTPGSDARVAFGALIVAIYTFLIGFELWRERRKSLYSRTAAVVVPLLHAVIFSAPLAIKLLLPEMFSAGWLAVFALETMVYATGTAFIVLLMVKDYHLHIERHAASTDSLTGLLNRGAFIELALTLCAQQSKRGEPVTLLMFDLDHFKRVNDHFGHATGDDVLRLFAQAARRSMRANDIIGRVGGEEFAAIVPAPIEIAVKIAERLRAHFQSVGATVGAHKIGATVSIGLAAAQAPVTDLDALIARADAALYRAKHDGRNRLSVALDGPAPSEPSPPVADARSNTPEHRPRANRKTNGRARAIGGRAPITGEGATSHLPYRR